MKYRLLRILDVAGLGVFSPVVRFLCGEEPRAQLKKIFLFIIVPVIVFAGFVASWAYLGPRHRTKSGEVPSPGVVLDAYRGIESFHDREYTKLADFERDGEERERAIADVQDRLGALEVQLGTIDTQLAELEAKERESTSARVARYEAAIAAKAEAYRLDEESKRSRLVAWGDTIATDDRESRALFLRGVELLEAERATHRSHLQALRSELTRKRGPASPILDARRSEKSELEEEQQFLRRRLDYLSKDNRSRRKEAAELALVSRVSEYLGSEGGERLFLAAGGVLSQREQIERIQHSGYAKPPTFFDQIVTSLQCVFLGFLIATAIAVPLGILCGLSPVCMASLSPLISLFKPVSPIVWLPIVFIIVGGFIPTPEDSWVAPAFLSSAITVALCSLWPTLVNTALGVASIDPDHINVARMLRLSFRTRLLKIVIPSALPLAFTGMRISLGVGWMVLIAAELLSSSPGLGKFVWDMFNNGSSETFAQMFVVVFVVGGVGFLLDRMMVVLQRLVSFDEAPTAL